MPIVNAARSTVPAQSPDKPIICWNNLFTDPDGTITASGITDVANAYDWFPHDCATMSAASGYIKIVFTSARAADYYAFYGYSAGSGASWIDFSVEYGLGGTTSTISGSTVRVAAGETRPFIVTFDRTYAKEWRFVFSSDSSYYNRYIAVVSIGTRMKMQRGMYTGMTPPTFARNDVLLNSGSQGGTLLGRSLIRSGVSGNLVFDHMTAAWVRDTLDPFITHSRTGGWFLAWYPNRYPDEVAYCWTTGTPQPNNTSPGRMGVQIDYEGRTE